MKISYTMKNVSFTGLCCLIMASCGATAAQADAGPGFGEWYPLEVLPSQSQRMTDPQAGAELLFLTSGPTDNENLYFHERSWLQDNSMILFYARHDYNGLMGYVVATGELLELRAADGTPLGGATAACTSDANPSGEGTT